uniref:Uncharacterized protein n=1 Tax=Octopus bimaculoides TaxID=37653 RepID=A0A0L8HQ54_OCTBM
MRLLLLANVEYSGGFDNGFQEDHHHFSEVDEFYFIEFAILYEIYFCVSSKESELWRQLGRLKKSKGELLLKIAGLKKEIVEIENQENEAIRELELEQALLEGEHQTEMNELQVEQELINQLKKKHDEIVEKAALERERCILGVSIVPPTLVKLLSNLQERKRKKERNRKSPLT